MLDHPSTRRISILFFPTHKYNEAMKSVTSYVLDRLLEPLALKLTPAVARELVNFRIDATDQARIADLGQKCNDGLLTSSERQEYEEYIRVGDFITILQSKARRILKKTRKS
jgi:hypothetical protein